MTGHNTDAAIILSQTGAKSVLVMGNNMDRPTQPIVRNFTNNKVAFWGIDNLFPQHLIYALNKNGDINAIIGKHIKLTYAAGWEFGVSNLDASDKETFVPVMDKDLITWCHKSSLSRYMLESISDFHHFVNVFTEMKFTPDMSKLTGLYNQETAYCRMGVQNENGILDTCYINAQWQFDTVNSERTITMPMIDPYFDPVGSTRLRTGSTSYIYPSSYPSPGRNYYQLASWNSVRESGWLELANLIPAFKKAIMENQITLKYIIYVPLSWWKWKYPKWETFTEADKAAKYKLEHDKFEKHLSSIENSGKSLMLVYKDDATIKSQYSGWEFKLLNDAYKEGAYIEDSQEATAHLMFALDMPAALMGNSPSSSGVGGGSGSDVREYLNLYFTGINACLDILCEPVNFMLWYNGHVEQYMNGKADLTGRVKKGLLKMRFKQPYLQTLNNVTPAARQNTVATNAV